MTCYSAPFDHPNADSIGERFLRLPDRGAIAFFGASWRNSPPRQFSLTLLREFLNAPTVGEAIQRAKRQTENPDMLEMYTLLGDPAVPIPRPALEVSLEPAGSGWRARVPEPEFLGLAHVEWLDGASEVLAETTLEVSSTFDVDAGPDGTAGVRVYAWSPESGLDAWGHLR